MMQAPPQQDRVSLAGITPLGVLGSALLLRDWGLDAGFRRAFPVAALTRDRILSLVHGEDVLRELWPAPRARGGWELQAVQRAIIAACKRKGVQDPDRLGFTATFVLREWDGEYLRRDL